MKFDPVLAADRALCLVVGHTWEQAMRRDAKRCVHCGFEMSAIEVIAYWRRSLRTLGLFPAASEALRRGWPKRTWPRWLGRG